jgi:hypothetical protein
VIALKKDNPAKAKEEKKAEAKTDPMKAPAKAEAKTEARGEVVVKMADGSLKTETAPEAPKDMPKESPEQAEINQRLKEIETSMFALRFYPVAVNEDAKNEAVAKLDKIYKESNETVKQMLLYMVHELLSTSMDLKIIHTLEYFKMKHPAMDPSQQRMNVYRSIFNYNTSLEGLTEVIRFLGKLNGDDAAKLLSYHYSHLCSVENEASHVLRAAILDALGASESRYALLTLLEYARYTDNERVFNRIVNALVTWEDKVAGLKIPEKEKTQIRDKLKEIITSEFGGSHYG